MDSSQKKPREMTDEEIANWMQDLMERAADEKGTSGGACSFEAIRHPVRRNILMLLDEKPLDIKEVSQKIGLEGTQLKFHLNFLESSSFIAIDGDMVDLTPGGVSVVRNTKR